MQKKIKLSFDLKEKPEEEDIKAAKLTDATLCEVISKETPSDRRFEVEQDLDNFFKGKYKIDNRLKNWNIDFTKDKNDPIRLYDILRLKKYLFKSRKIHGYNLIHLLNKSSYMSVHPFKDYYERKQSDLLDKVEKDIETGMEYQLTSPIIPNFAEEVQWQKNRFCQIVNGDGHCFSDKYVLSLKNQLDDIACELHKIVLPKEYSVFENFYQVIVLKRAAGIYATQQSIDELMSDILKSNLTSVSSSVASLFQSQSDEVVDCDANTFLLKEAENIAPIVFDGTGIDTGEGIKILRKPSNLKKVDLAYKLIYGETRYGQNTKRQPIRIPYIISICRAMFAISEFVEKKTDNIKGNMLYRRIYNMYGYLLPMYEQERSISFRKDLHRFEHDENDIREYAARLLLEITNACYLMYFGRKDFAIKRFEIESKFDKFISETLELGDYKFLNIFYERFYEKLRNVVLPVDFITYLMENTLGEPVIITDNFADFLRELILAGCRGMDQSPMYYIEIFFKTYRHERDFKFWDNFSFTFDFKSSSYEIVVTKSDILFFDMMDLSRS